MRLRRLVELANDLEILGEPEVLGVSQRSQPVADLFDTVERLGTQQIGKDLLQFLAVREQVIRAPRKKFEEHGGQPCAAPHGARQL